MEKWNKEIEDIKTEVNRYKKKLMIVNGEKEKIETREIFRKHNGQDWIN